MLFRLSALCKDVKLKCKKMKFIERNMFLVKNNVEIIWCFYVFYIQ